MKRMIIAALFLAGAVSAFAGELDLNGFLWLTNPQSAEASADDVLVSARIGAGVGYCFRGEGTLNPGLEARLSAFPLAGMLKARIFMMEAGARLYNSFPLGKLDLQPFGGATFYMNGYQGVSDSAVRFELGARALFGKLGLEYAAIIPGEDVTIVVSGMDRPLVTLGTGLAHRFTLSYHILKP